MPTSALIEGVGVDFNYRIVSCGGGEFELAGQRQAERGNSNRKRGNYYFTPYAMGECID